MKKLTVVILMLFVAQFTNAQCFQSAMHFPVDTGLVDMATANFNGDTIPDLVTISSVHDSIYVMIGNGDGTFGAPIISLALPLSNQKAESLFIEDLNRDNLTDVAIFDGKNVNILLGNGNGTFSVPVTYNAFTFRNITSMTMGDFDGDSLVDFVTYEYDIMGYPFSNNDGINFLKGNGDGTFASSTLLTIFSGVYQKLAPGDFNNDGNLDIVCMTYPNSHSGRIAFGNGDGTFYPPINSAYSTGTMGNDLPFIRVGDFDRDGNLDLISCGDYLHGPLTDGVRLVYGRGNGGFISPPEVIEGYRWASDMVLDDFNGDGITDAATSHYPIDTVSVYIGTDTGSFRAHVDFAVGDYPSGIITADFNGDGLIDIATCNRDSKNVSILLNRNANITFIDSAANCQNVGSVRVDVQGGNPPFSYLWETGDTTNFLSGITSGVYSLEVTDSFGCVIPYSGTLSSGIITVDSVIVDDATCNIASDGSINMHTTSINPPVSYQWSNGDTTQLITGLATGTYSVTLTDTLGCFTTSSTMINISGLTTDIMVLDSSGGCVSDTNGALLALALNGEAPYTYSWDNGSTSDTAVGLAPGGYSVTVTDSSGCHNTRHEFVPSDYTCYSNISGRLYCDVDSSCSYSNGDIRLANKMVVIAPGFYARTNSIGSWSTSVPPGNYNIYTTDPKLNAICGTDTIPLTVSSSSPITGINIYKQLDTVDIETHLFCNIARLGDTQQLSISVQNNGTLYEPMTGVLNLDPAIINPPTATSSSYIDSVSSNHPYKVYFSSSIASQNVIQFYINVNIPAIPTTFIGQSIGHGVTVTTTTRTDQVLSNNSDTCTQLGVAAYDPNDKRVFSNNANINGLASVNDTLLEYAIRFQNTGNDTAKRVFIRDTIDTSLDIGSFKLLANSHPVYVEFFPNRIIQFTFNNINLPDSNINEPQSHGYVEYELRVTDPTQLLPITNTAHIYFDYNPPITTNTVLTLRDDNIDISGDTSYCPGDNISISGDQIPIVDYYWTYNGTVISGADQTTIIATDTGDYQMFLVYGDDTLSSNIHHISSRSGVTLSLSLAQSSVCEDASSVAISVSPNGGSLSGTGVTGMQFDPSVAGVGSHSITYFYNDTSGCGNISTTDSIVVNPLPNTSLAAADNSVCIDAAQVTVTTSPTGGSLTGTGISGTSFDPSTAGTGTHTITYSYTDGNGCSAIAEDTVTVNALPNVSVTLADDVVCADATAVAITTSPTGGTLSGTGVNGSEIDPTIAGIGTSNVSYVYTDANGCSNTSTADIEVLELPTVGISLPADTFCTDEVAIDLTGYGSPAGGVYSGSAVVGNTLDISNAGTISVDYTYTDTNGCANKAVASLEVEVCIGIDDIDNNLLNVYPNPTNGTIYIELAGTPIDEVLVYNATGELVLQQTFNGTAQAELDLSELPAGVHLLRTNSNGNWFQSRVVVSR